VRPICLALIVLAALVAAGCGASSGDSAGDFKGEARVVAVAVEDLEDAGRNDEPARICSDLLADSLLTRLRQGGTTCRTAVDEVLKDVDSFDKKVDRVAIAGTKATVRVTSGSGNDEKTDTLTLERDGRAWKIASLGGAGS
jgi:hypothetical protein